MYRDSSLSFWVLHAWSREALPGECETGEIEQAGQQQHREEYDIPERHRVRGWHDSRQCKQLWKQVEAVECEAQPYAEQSRPQERQPSDDSCTGEGVQAED